MVAGMAHHWRPLYVTYHANRVSCASCCTLLYVVCLIVLPYITVFALGGLWTKEAPVREQPRVRFRYELLMEAHASTSTEAIVPIGWSTSQSINDALGAAQRPCTLRAWEEDDELDGYPDRLQFVVAMPIDANAGERVLSASVLLGLDVAFSRDFQLRLNASVRLDASSPLAGKRWEQTADLTLRSNEPQRSLDLQPRQPCPSPTWAFQQPVLPSGAAASASSILAHYARCNDTIVPDSRHSIWTPGVADEFEAHITLRVPPLLTSRRPGYAHLTPTAPMRALFCRPRSHARARGLLLLLRRRQLRAELSCHPSPSTPSSCRRPYSPPACLAFQLDAGSLVETFKLALVQYIAFFIPIGAILSCIHSALYRFGVVASRVHHPIKKHQF